MPRELDIEKLLIAAGGVIIILVLSHWVRRTLSRSIDDPAIRYRVRKLVALLTYLIIIILVSAIFWTRLGGLTVFFGVAGAGVAFALQEVIASVAGWLALSFGGYYHVGDRVRLGETTGDVIDISVLRTTLMEVGEWVQADLYTGRIVRIANSFVFKAPVFNYSGDFPFLWDEIHLPIKYGGDRELAREILTRVAEEITGDFTAAARAEYRTMQFRYRIEQATIDPMVTLIANDNWLEYTVRYIVDYRRRRSTKDRLFTRILEEFDKTDGKVTMSSTTVQVVGLPPINIRMSEDGEARKDGTV